MRRGRKKMSNIVKGIRRRKYKMSRKWLFRREGFLRCKGTIAEGDCAPSRVRRFFQNWSEELIARKVVKKNFFSRWIAIFTSFHEPYNAVSKKLWSVSKKGMFLQLNKPSNSIRLHHSVTTQWNEKHAFHTSNWGESIKTGIREVVKWETHTSACDTAYKGEQSISPNSYSMFTSLIECYAINIYD